MNEETNAPGGPSAPGTEVPATETPGTGIPETGLPGTEVEPGMLERGIELIQSGGPVVIILMGMSVIALAIVLVKLWQFHMSQVDDRQTARRALRLYRSGQAGQALSLLQASNNPIAQALARTIRGQRRGIAEHKIREEVLRYGGDILESLRGWFRPLEVIASLAPLLGLFGTVLGMIEAFRQLEAAGNKVNPAILSGGIWEALLTTAVGLAVAIPVVVVLNWLERKVDRLAHEMDSVVTSVFTEDLSDHDIASEVHEPAGFAPAAAPAGQ